MAWCRQATSHCLNRCWPKSPTPCGASRPQWVNNLESTALSSFYVITVSHHIWSLEGKMLDVLIATLFLYILWESVQNILSSFSDVCQFLGKYIRAVFLLPMLDLNSIIYFVDCKPDPLGVQQDLFMILRHRLVSIPPDQCSPSYEFKTKPVYNGLGRISMKN